MLQSRDHKESFAILWRAGFTHGQIERLSRFRKGFILGTLDQTPLEHRRLEFVRWLFIQGKLSDHIRSPREM